MKITKTRIKEIIREVLAENDAHPQILKKNNEVIHHTLFEDGTITKYDVKFGNKTIKNIPTEMLEVVELQEHSHEATDEDDEEKEEGSCS
jgi:phage baseplate assembly protein gpV